VTLQPRDNIAVLVFGTGHRNLWNSEKASVTPDPQAYIPASQKTARLHKFDLTVPTESV
jgi:hypothetical protein